MGTRTATPDRVFAVLDPLVRDATLSPAQADRAFAALTTALPVTAGEADDGRLPTSEASSRTPWFVAAATLGCGLVMAAFWISAARSGDADFEWKTFLAMLAVVVVSAAAAVASHVLLRQRRVGRWMTGVFGALACLTLPLSVMVTWGADGWVYFGGTFMVAAGVAGYWFLSSHPATLLAAFGGSVILVQAFADTVDVESGVGDILNSGVAFMVYGVVVAGAGWRFGCRNTTGLAGGAIAVAAMLYVIAWLGVTGVFVAGFGEPGATMAGIRGDIRPAMLLGLAVAAALLAAYAVTQHIGYLIESFVAASLLPFAATLLGRSEHPLRWALAFGLVGAGVLAVAVWGVLRGGEPAGSSPVARQRQPSSDPGPAPTAHLGPGETVSW